MSSISMDQEDSSTKPHICSICVKTFAWRKSKAKHMQLKNVSNKDSLDGKAKRILPSNLSRGECRLRDSELLSGSS